MSRVQATSLAVGPMHAFVHPVHDGRHTLTINFEIHGPATLTLRLTRPDLETLRGLILEAKDGGATGEEFLFSLEIVSEARAALMIVRPAQLFSLQFHAAELRELARAIGEVL